ncbi:hypothetical protein Tco_0983985, partial [Tanacetum coccineum]
TLTDLALVEAEILNVRRQQVELLSQLCTLVALGAQDI